MMESVFQARYHMKITNTIEIVIGTAGVLMDNGFLATLDENDVKSQCSLK